MLLSCQLLAVQLLLKFAYIVCLGHPQADALPFQVDRSKYTEGMAESHVPC